MSSQFSEQPRFRISMRFFAKLILGVTLLLWMIPEIYMVSVALRPPDAAFEPQLITWPMLFR